MTADRTADTAAVLDEMVAGIMGVKANKAAKLTPVGTETAKMPSFPSDLPGAYMSKEGMKDAAEDLRRWATELLQIANGLDIYAGTDTRPQLSDPAYIAAEAQKAKEREADARVAAADPESLTARMARLQQEAQAAVGWIDLDAPTEEPAPERPKSTWLCPKHGDEDVRDRTSPKGRHYNACHVPNCKEFEKA